MTRTLTRSARIAVLAAAALSLPPIVATAQAAPSRPARQAASSPNPGQQNFLTGVQTLTKRDAWAVGYYCARNCDRGGTDLDLIEHWNGARWSRVAGPQPGEVSQLTSVSAVSAGNIWAVGTYQQANSIQALVLHWNGTRWSQVATKLTAIAAITGITADSARDAWIAGIQSVNGEPKTLIAHWNGHAWRQVSSPNPGASASLFAISSSSAANVWAVGQYCVAKCTIGVPVFRGLILRWHDSRWSAAPVKGSRQVTAVDVIAGSDAWAAGLGGTVTDFTALLLHWNGQTWAKVANPGIIPAALAFGSANDGWGMVGGPNLHWIHGRWQVVDLPVPSAGTFEAASAAQPADVWAVGSYCARACTRSSRDIDSLAEQWNGHAWTRH
jgi:hypothetical protein